MIAVGWQLDGLIWRYDGDLDTDYGLDVLFPTIEPGELKPITHGTPAGARLHRNRGELPCPECLSAQRADNRDRYRRRRRAQHGR